MCVSRLVQPLTLLLVLAALAGCATSSAQPPRPRGPDPYFTAMYGPHPDEAFPLPATDISKVDPRFLRQQVPYPTYEPPGTIVVDTPNRYLYLVQGDGMALRYGIGVGKAGLEFAGEARIGRKAQWPRWIPTSDMVAREPERYGPLAGGLDPGLTNPLGPRALYLYQDGKDTLFRIHGTTEAWSIGKAVSSGCIRMFNPDVIDLYNRVPEGTRVVVIQAQSPMEPAMPPIDAPMQMPAEEAPLAF
ncbi:L,D-transpeptidase [Sinorhizobium americanum]|uniref:Lipoprotein-anchoring transpeptidase ErfK/SrfK n=1 Tax=Sinorhizobium americanum TaxID=194963 RepID=A0A4V2RF13_9HYPH|nr:L,D-transpeptidase [Sinorhizobium americanum]TCN30860.1 lipoprotein-anchoring transpeptidase ErfK/SrfK [Sinorhizobium americanum]